MENKLNFCENHFAKSLENLDSTVFENRKLLSNSVSSLTKFEYLSENASSLASDNCTSDKYLCDDTQRMINNEKHGKRRRIIFCCLG